MHNSHKFFFCRFIRPQIYTMVLLIALGFLGDIFTFISPLIFKSLIDDVFLGGRVNLFSYIIMATAATYIISALSNYISNYKKSELELKIFNNIARETFNTVQLASLRESQEIKTGDMLSRILTNTRTAITIFTYVLPDFIMSAIRIVTPLTIMLFYDIELTLIVIIPAFLFILPMYFFGRKLERTQMASLVKTASVYSFLKESLSMIPLIKVFGLERWSRNKFSELMSEYYDASLDYTKNNSMGFSVNSLMYGIPMVLLIIFGGPMVMKGSMTIGTFTLFMSNAALAFAPVLQFSVLWSSYKSSLPAFDRVKEVFQLEQDNGGDERLRVKDGVVEFEDVWFSYNNRSILQGFNATFMKGLNYIVGDNGTGKSTILKLVCSLYPLQRGHIRIDGQDISRVRRGDLRKNISMIFSDPYLFDGSIYENILIGNLSSSKEKIVHAAKLVRVHEFIMNLSQGYETQVGESGLKLSSGEKQKIALARAVLKNSPIILLDEVTKSIDAESRKSINEVIKNLKNEKTIIIITHNTGEIEQGNNIVYLGQESQRNDRVHRTIDVPASKVIFL